MTCHQYGSDDDVVKMAKEVGGWGGKESGWISVCRPQKSPTVCPRKNGRPNISVWQEQTLQSSTCAIVGDFLFALSCNIAWLSLRVSALWLLRNYFTTRPLRVKHDFVWIVCSEAILQGVRAFVTLPHTICKSHGGLKYLWKSSQIFVAISRFMAALGSPPVELSPLCRKTARPHNWLLYGLFQAP